MARELLEELKHRAPEFDPTPAELEHTQREVVRLLDDADGAANNLRAVRKLRRTWNKLGPEIVQRMDASDAHRPQADLYRVLRLVRVEIVDLRSITAFARQGKASVAELRAFAFPSGRHRKADRRSVDDLLADAERMIRTTPQLQRYSDELRHLQHIWNQVCSVIEGKLREQPTDTAGAFERIEQLCRDAIFRIGWRTIPERLNSWLNHTAAGSCVSFHDAFEDEIPDREDRVKFLKMLAPTRIPGGLVDPQTGVVYKYSRSRGWLIASTVVVIGSLIALTAAAGLCAVPSRFGFIDREYGLPIFLGWMVILLGVALHLATDAFKRTKQGGPPGGTLASVHPVQWINARFWHIALRIVMIVVGYLGGMAVYYKQDLDALIVSMFLVGYGLDSFVGIFTTNVEQRAAAQAEELKKTLAPTA